MSVRLEVLTPLGWVDVMGSTASITVTRSPMQVGNLTAQLADVDLDPARVDTLASGRPVRLMARTGSTTWAAMYTGVIDSARASYGKPNTPGANPARAVAIELAAVDAMKAIGATPEARSVATTTDLRTLLAASGLPWAVNGTTAAGPAQPAVVAVNPGSFLADQVALTRDTVAGHAWVDAANVLQVRDPGAMPAGVAATYSDTGEPSYTAVDASYDSLDVVDAVEVTFLKYKPSAGATEQVTHTVRRPGSTGTNVRTYSIGGPAMTDAQIQAYCTAYAQTVLDRHATAQIRPLSLTTPLVTNAQRLAASQVDLCAAVRVILADRNLDARVRVASIEHQISVVDNAARPLKWVTTYTYDSPDAVPESQALNIVRPAPVQDRLAATEDPATIAARLQGQTVDNVTVLSETRPAQDPDDAGGLSSSVTLLDEASGVYGYATRLSSTRSPVTGTRGWIEVAISDDGDPYLAVADPFMVEDLISQALRSGVVSTGAFTAVNTGKSIPITFARRLPYRPRIALTVIGANVHDLAVGLLELPTPDGFTLRAARRVGLGEFDVQWTAHP